MSDDRKRLALGFTLRFTLLLAATWHASAIGQHAHVHGSATLQVAVEGRALTLTFLSPLDGLLGFERAPRTAKEKAAAADLMARLRKPEAWFVPTQAASCKLASTRISAPVLEAGATAADGHAELSAEYTYRCEHPEALHGLEVKLFDSFRRLRRVQAEVAGPKGQSAATLTPARRQLSW
jgi:hypothetical protein